jgi:hypothetical protein
LLIDDKGRFGQANTPRTTLPSSSRASAIAYWSPLKKLIQITKKKIWMREGHLLA